MGALAAGQVVLLPFPFSDLSGSKYRPALLLASVGRGDWVACQITSNPYGDRMAITIDNAAFADGGLQRVSYVRPGKLFTASDALIGPPCGTLRPQMFADIQRAIAALLLQSGADEASVDPLSKTPPE